MPQQQPIQVSLIRPGPHIVQGELEFVGLVQTLDKEIIRLRFARGRGTTLDIPMSAAALAELAQTLYILHGVAVERVADEIEYYRQQGGPVLNE